ncbi:hypothetical protein DPMN_160395 [Dreissena polymorpha]|uniref:Uncharacterized protein n=1 Tax=Dreissena polymorpha TaxID=45954 RepID=A0A9D4IQ32_DREPO|nr:hypothetical protein DPMN_160395 [Dreissena polymorpha]
MQWCRLTESIVTQEKDGLRTGQTKTTHLSHLTEDAFHVRKTMNAAKIDLQKAVKNGKIVI